MKPTPESVLVKILETDSLTDIALIKNALDSADVRYLLQGENMKFMRPNDPVILMVTKEDEAKVIDILRPLKLSFSWIRF